MELRGELWRDNGVYGFVVQWEVRKVLPFTPRHECKVLASGEAGSYEAAGKALGLAMEQCRPKEVKKKV